MPSTTPSTALARWSSVNAQTGLQLLGRTITTNLNGLGAGRRAVQIRPFRLPPAPAAGGAGGAGAGREEGRNMFVVRALSTAEQLVVFVEDPGAPGRGEVGASRDEKGKGKAKVPNEDQEMEIIDPPQPDAPTSASPSTPTPPPTHSRWSHLSLGSSSSGSAVGPFDAFLQRVLLGGSAAANNPAAGAWVPRATAVSLEGWVFSVGGGAGAGAGAGAVGDWEIRVDAVNLKGGAASGASRGLVVEATYLAVPHLPPNSTFVSDFLLSLFPSTAVAAGEVELITVPDATFVEAGLLPAPVADEGADEAEREWEWADKHSCFAYVQAFRKEGLL